MKEKIQFFLLGGGGFAGKGQTLNKFLVCRHNYLKGNFLYFTNLCHFVSLEEKKLQCFFFNFPSFKKKSLTKLIWKSSNFLILLKIVFYKTLIFVVDLHEDFMVSLHILSCYGCKFTNMHRFTNYPAFCELATFFWSFF